MNRKSLVELTAELRFFVGRVYSAISAFTEALRGKQPRKRPKPRRRFGDYERVEESKFRAIGPPLPLPLEPGDLPDSYGQTKVVALVVDPYMVHAYWEVTPSTLEEAEVRLGESHQRAQAALRFLEIADAGSDVAEGDRNRFDVDVELGARNWYVRLWNPEKKYVVDLGFRSTEGRFVSVARSNVIAVPRAWPESRATAEYMLVEGDYETVGAVPPPVSHVARRQQRVYAASAGLGRVVAEAELPRAPFPDAMPERSMDGPTILRPAGSREILKEKLAELSGFREWGEEPVKPEETTAGRIHESPEAHTDLTDLSEKDFTHGISSAQATVKRTT